MFIFSVPQWLLPGPHQVALAFAKDFLLIIHHTWYTLGAALAGFGLAVLLAGVTVLLMDLTPALRRGIYPLLVISQTIPIITIAPLLVIWFGYGLLPKVLVVALVCFFPVAVSATQGMSDSDPDLNELLLVMGAGKLQIMKLARIPSALPAIFTGMKIAATYSVMGAVIGEWLGASRGLGVFMNRAAHSYQPDRVFAAIFVVVLLSLSMFAFIELLSRWLLPWQRVNGR